MMKNISYVFILFLLIIPFSEARDVSLLEDRAGLKYVLNEEIPFTGKHVEYWEDDQAKQRIITNYKDGKLGGLATEWHENGKKKSEVNYRDDLKEGLT
ncbi:MAG: antitoxin component YwqK of YwqJK toxin-antitoxin module, partial [Gammaproteobacteria bacterium]